MPNLPPPRHPLESGLHSRFTAVSDLRMYFGRNGKAIPPLLLTVLKMVPFDETKFNAHAANLERALKRVQAALESGSGEFPVGDQVTLADKLFMLAIIFNNRNLNPLKDWLVDGADGIAKHVW